jgi:hypothetical protein
MTEPFYHSRSGRLFNPLHMAHKKFDWPFIDLMNAKRA